jgi:hypothetical protein
MKSIFFTFLIVTGLHALNIVKVEYYIDNDPGFGNATEVVITPAQELSLSFEIDLTNLSPGFHQLYVRSKDDSGRWGLPFSKPFYIDKIIPDYPNILQIGYTIDQGDLRTVDVSSETTVDHSFVIDLSGLSPGFHSLLVSAFDNRGLSSLVYEKAFYIDDQAEYPKITAIEYFFSQPDTTTPVSIHNQFTPATYLDLAIDLDVSGLNFDESYYVHVYGRDQTGQRGFAYNQEFKVGSMNSIPVISGLPETIRFNADSSFNLNIWDYTYDYETPDTALLFKFTTSTDSLHTSFDSINGVLLLTANAAHSGLDTLWIKVTDDSAASVEEMVAVIVDPSTGLETETDQLLPKQFNISQNYPNPFNPSTQIKVDLPKQEHVIIDIFNIRGQKVATLADQKMPAGYHIIEYTPVNFSTGILFYRIQAGKFHDVKKMILIK